MHKMSLTDNKKEASELQKEMEHQIAHHDMLVMHELTCESDVNSAEGKDQNLPPQLPPKLNTLRLTRQFDDQYIHLLQESTTVQEELYKALPIRHPAILDFEEATKATNCKEINKCKHNSEQKVADHDQEEMWEVESYEENTKWCKEENKDEEAAGGEAVHESSVTTTETKLKTRKRNTSSSSIFGSFKVGTPIKLVEELLSGEEWAQFLDKDQTHLPNVPLSASEDTAQPATDVFNPKAHQETLPDEIDGSDCRTEHKRVHKVIELYLKCKPDKQTEVQQGPVQSAIPATLMKSEADPISPRTKDILKSVTFIEETQPPNPNAPEDELLHHHHSKRKDSGSQSPHKVIMSSVFYDIPGSTPAPEDEAEPQLTIVKSVRGSSRILTRIKTKLRKQSREENS